MQFKISYNLLTAPQAVSNTYAKVAWAQSCANLMQHIQHLPCATCRVTCHVVWRDSSAIKVDRVAIAFIWALFYWLNHRWRRGGNRSTRRKPQATSFRKCHILQPEDTSPKRDSNPHSSIGGRLGKQTCYPVTPSIAPTFYWRPQGE